MFPPFRRRHLAIHLQPREIRIAGDQRRVKQELQKCSSENPDKLTTRKLPRNQ